MSICRTTARLGAVPAAAVVATLALAGPASAHVTGTPSDATAGAYTVMTMSVPHGCEGSPTTKIEISVPESVLSITPTRNPFYDVETTIAQLDEPVTDAHGNEVTERTASVVYTARTPLPDDQRDTFELSFQVPDDAGEMLAFPTVQTCEKGETGWTEIPEAGQSEDELEHPAPAFEILPPAEGGEQPAADTAAAEDAENAGDASAATGDTTAAEESDSDALGWVGVVLGAAGLLVGGTALARSRTRA
jgi:uncharacterized protein YcnI